MNRGIYATSIGMIGLQRGLDVTANNLANASTVGFKRDGLVFQDTLERKMFANGGLGEEVGSLGSGANAVDQYTVQQAGAITTTGNPFDMAIASHEGMFGVRVGDKTLYTRDGAFAIDDQRRLVTKSGYPVLDTEENEIVIPAGQMEVQTGGRILVGGNFIAQVGVFKPAGNAEFLKAGENLYQVTGNAEPVANAQVTPGSLESSNVNAVESMLDMVKIGRLFELSQKSIQSQDELLQRLISSLNE